MLFEELYFALLDVSAAACRDKIPGPLATLHDMVHKNLELWRRDERAAGQFAALVLQDDDAILHRSSGKIPELSRTATWRLISCLEYLAEIYGQ